MYLIFFTSTEHYSRHPEVDLSRSSLTWWKTSQRLWYVHSTIVEVCVICAFI